MAFFDEFGRKFSNLSQNAVQKTRGVADGARINSSISEEERNLNNIYRDLGHAYCQLHYNDAEPQLKNIVIAAVETEKKLAFLYQQQQLQGLVRCPSCGNMAPINSVFCNTCGCKLPPVNHPMNSSQCPRCGNMLSFPSKFCNRCGLNLESISPAPQMPAPPASGVNSLHPAVEPSRTMSCPKCGASINGNLKFCTMCGCKLEQSTPPFSQVPETPAVMPDTNETVTCKSCGAVVKAGLNFCTNCGCKMNNENKDISKEVPDINTNGEQSSENPDINEKINSNSENDYSEKSNESKCPKCGSPVGKGLKFCVSCGTRLTETADNKPNSSVSNKDDLSVTKKNEDKKTQDSVPELSADNVKNTPQQELNADKTDTNKSDLLSNEPDFQQSPESNDIRCPSCGSQVKKGLKFCELCGTKLTAESDSKPESSVSEKKILSLTKEVGVKKTKTSAPELTADNVKNTSQPKSDSPESNKESVFNQSSVSNDIRCPNCGSKVKKGLKFCVFCGTKLKASVSEKDNLSEKKEDVHPEKITAVPELSAESVNDASQQKLNVQKPNINESNFQQSPDSDSIKCPNCGSSVRKGLKFCVSCGFRLLAENIPQSPMPPKPQPPVSPNQPFVGLNNPFPQPNSQVPNMPMENSGGFFKNAFQNTPNNNAAAVCPKCGTPARTGMKFCVSCGTKLIPPNSLRPPQPSMQPNEPYMGKPRPGNMMPEAPFGKPFASAPPIHNNGMPLGNEEDYKTKFAAPSTMEKPQNIHPPFMPEKKDSSYPNSQKNNEFKCFNCGSKLEPNLKFCTVCGTKLNNNPQKNISPSFPAQSNSRNKKKCMKCGSLEDASMLFCTACGTPLDGFQSIPLQNNSENSVPFGKKKCSNCGTVLDSEMRFCTSCGVAFGNNSNPAPPARSLSNDSNKTIYAYTEPPLSQQDQPENFQQRNSPPDFGNPFAGQPSHNGKVCPKCKAVMPNEMLFCTECGTKI